MERERECAPEHSFSLKEQRVFNSQQGPALPRSDRTPPSQASVFSPVEWGQVPELGLQHGHQGVTLGP